MPSTRWAAVGCTHGHYIDHNFRAAFLQWTQEWNPQLRVHLGDVWDFECLRSGATDREQADGLAEDIEAGNDFLRDYFSGGEIKVLDRGNHCERLWKMRTDANGVRREYAEEIASKLERHVASLGAHMLPYHVRHGVLRVGGLVFIHGISYALNAGTIHANTFCERGQTVVFTHTHAANSGSVPHHPAPTRWLNAGCGRTLCPEYAERRVATLKWEHAWAYGEIFADGSYTANLYKFNTPLNEKENGLCLMSSNCSPMPCAPEATVRPAA